MSFIDEFTDTPSPETADRGVVVVDVSNLIFRAIYGSGEFKRAGDVNVDIIRHMAWNIILKHRRLHARDRYQDLVLAFDGPSYWRKRPFPEYKKNRESKHESGSPEEQLSTVVTACFREVRDELYVHSPFPVVMVKGAEADDVMAWTPVHPRYNRAVVVTGDKDMKQLIAWENNVRVWSPGQGVDGAFVPMGKRDAEEFLHELICKGDSGDGIPNVHMPNDAFYPVRVARQKPVSAKMVESLKTFDADPTKFSAEVQHGFRRNRHLIDLRYTPPEIVADIHAELDRQTAEVPSRRASLYKYFMAKGLHQHTTNIQQFL